MRRLVVIALALSAVPPAGAMAAESRVHTGSPVAVPPYMAFLTGSTDDAYWTCGATAISRNVVLTAAHCVLDPATEKYADSANLGLVFGQDDPRAALAQHTAKITRVVRYVASAYYGWFENGVVTHDVAVLQTQDPVPGVIPILPPERTDMLKVGSQGWFMGWGRTDESDEDSSSTSLRAAPIPVRSSFQCAAWLEHYNNHVMLCTGGEEAAAPCTGDSGGPLIVSDPVTGGIYQAGVVSFGQECQVSDSLNVFARVAGAELYDFVTKAAARLQEDASPVYAANSSTAPALGFARARAAAASFSVRHWHWTVTGVRCTRRLADGIACRVDGSRRGRRYFARMFVTLDVHGRTAISAAR